MEKIIAVRFKKNGKLAYLSTDKYIFKVGDLLICSTEQGEEIARVVKLIDKDKVPNDSKVGNVTRPVEKQDIQKYKKNKEMANDALKFCKAQVEKLGLDMKLISAEYTYDASKLTIYFTSEDRVDFRELVKTLATKYKSRIELRQIGPRDEVKMYPNIGICGREVCCRAFLEEFEPVTIKMAKEQGLQINMPKLSGACGKLMCCLKYEQETYKENLDKLPKVGSYVTNKDGERGKVTNVDILGLKVKVKFGEDEDDIRYDTYPVSEIKFTKKVQKKDDEEKEGK